MRTFSQIQQELRPIKQGSKENFTLYVMPVKAGVPRQKLYYFDRKLTPSLIPACTSLLKAADEWLKTNPDLKDIVEVEPVVELGEDFFATNERIGTPYSLFFSQDEHVDRPKEFSILQSGFRTLAKKATAPKNIFLSKMLARLIFDAKGEMIFDEGLLKFVILEIAVTEPELENWNKL